MQFPKICMKLYGQKLGYFVFCTKLSTVITRETEIAPPPPTLFLILGFRIFSNILLATDCFSQYFSTFDIPIS